MEEQHHCDPLFDFVQVGFYDVLVATVKFDDGLEQKEWKKNNGNEDESLPFQNEQLHTLSLAKKLQNHIQLRIRDLGARCVLCIMWSDRESREMLPRVTWIRSLKTFF